MEFKNMTEVFHCELQGVCVAEAQLLHFSRSVSEVLVSTEVKKLAEEIGNDAETHCAELEAVCKCHGIDAWSRGELPIDALLAKGERIVRAEEGGPLLDTVLLVLLRKALKLQILEYSAVKYYAQQLEQSDTISAIKGMLRHVRASLRSLDRLVSSERSERCQKTLTSKKSPKELKIPA